MKLVALALALAGWSVYYAMAGDAVLSYASLAAAFVLGGIRRA